MRAVLLPKPPPTPQAPPNAWGPRTYPGAQQTQQAPPQQPKAQAPPKPPPQQPKPASPPPPLDWGVWVSQIPSRISPSSAWAYWASQMPPQAPLNVQMAVWVTWTTWISQIPPQTAPYSTTWAAWIAQAPPNAWGPQAPPQQPQAQQTQQGAQAPGYHPWGTPPQPKQYQQLPQGFKTAFWLTWVSFGIVGGLIGQIGKTGTPVSDVATATGFTYVLVGLLAAVIIAIYHVRIVQWLAAQKAQGKLWFAFWIVIVLIFFSMIPIGIQSDKAQVAADKQAPSKASPTAQVANAPNPPGQTWVGCSPVGAHHFTNAGHLAQSAVSKHLSTMYTTGRTGISFDVDASGKIHNLILDSPSGNDQLDSTSRWSILHTDTIKDITEPTKIGCFFWYDKPTMQDSDASVLHPYVLRSTVPAEQADYTMGIITAISKAYDFSGIKGINKGTTVLMFVIDPTGKHAGVDITSSSGSAELDQACTRAVDSVSFSALPSSTHGDSLGVEYRCILNEPDEISKVWTIPAGDISALADEWEREHQTQPVKKSEPAAAIPDSKPSTVPDWYVTAVKEKVAANWYLKEVMDSTPAGAVVYVQFEIGRKGFPGSASIQSSSGYHSLDESCLNAVDRVDSFGPLPAEYQEHTLNVVYHCTYPGKPLVLAPVPTNSAPVPPAPTYTTPAAPVPVSVAPVATPVSLKSLKGTYSGYVNSDPSILVLKPSGNKLKGCFESDGKALHVTGSYEPSGALELSVGQSGGTESSYIFRSNAMRSSGFSGDVVIQPSGVNRAFDFARINDKPGKCK